MGPGAMQSASVLVSSEKWRKLEAVLNGLMAWWRFLLLGAVLVVLLAPSPRLRADQALLFWLVGWAVYAVLALWLSVAFPAQYRTWLRMPRIGIDLAAIFIVMLLHPMALSYLWAFLAMRILAGFTYYDDRTWLWIYVAACLVIGAATLIAAAVGPHSLKLSDLAAVIGKCAVLGVITGFCHYLLRLIPRLSNAEYLAKTSLLLVEGLGEREIANLAGEAAKRGIPAADSVVVHRPGGPTDPLLRPVSSTALDVTQLGRTPMKIGEGVAGWALAHRETANVPDVNQDRRWMPLDEGGPRIVSLLVAPLYIGDRNLGTISVNSGRRRAFDDRDQQYLETVAGQVSLALANAELFQNRKRQREHLRDILAASLAFDPCQPVESLLNQLAEAVRNQSGYQMVAINFIDPATNTLLVRAMAGIPSAGREHLLQQRVPLPELEPYLKEEHRISQSYYTRHTQASQDPTLEGYFWTPDLGERGPSEWHQNDVLLVPIMEQSGAVSGYLSLDDPVDRQMPTFEDVQTLEVLARLVGSMVHTAQLFEQVARQRDHAERHANLQRLLHTISTVTAGLDSLERILHVYLTGITSSDGLGFNRACLLELEPGGGLRVKLAIGQFDGQRARAIWEGLVAGHQTIADYLLSVRAGAQFDPTDLHERLAGARFSVLPDGKDAFAAVLRDRNTLFVYPEGEPALPVDFAGRAEITTPAVVLSLIVGSQVLGVLVCDNKFTEAPPTNLDFLANFASHIAAVMEADRLRRAARYQAMTSGWREGMQYERFRLQDDMHEVLGEFLTGVKWGAERVAWRIENNDAYGAEEATDRLLERIESVYEFLDSMLYDLRRPFLAELGLMTALRQRAPVLQPGQVQIRGVVSGPLPPKIENELLRVGVEAMTNAARHSGAKADPETKIVVTFEMQKERAALSVADNGLGFDAEQRMASVSDRGLARMGRRVRDAGGAFEVMSKPGIGTEVLVAFPLDGAAP